MEDVQFRLSVRSLVEFILRSGDLDSRRSGLADKEAMLKGGKIHRKIQRQMGAGYQAEVPLFHVSSFPGFSVRVEGRADGILTEEERITVDEIKGVYRELSTLEEPLPVHQAQAMCYAYMYAVDHGLTEMSVQLTYCQMETEAVRRFVKTYTFEELEQWYQGLLKEYARWADFQMQWRKKRDASMAGLEFPFPYREGQRDIVTGVYRTILRGKQLFIQAPTGVGKTMSSVFPAVRAVGEGQAEKIFYLTAKTITRTVAEEAFSLLRQKGLLLKTVTITAKEKLCACDKVECNPQHCPRAKGHYDRVNEAVFQMLTGCDCLDREAIEEQAQRHSVCPFELCLDLTSWTDAVICDYNYVFDPNVRLKRFFSEGGKGDYVFLIDEAHNLVDRGREMFSAVLYKEDVLEAKRLLKPHSRKLVRLLDRVNKQLLEYKRECETYEILPNAGDLPVSLLNLMGELEAFLEEPPEEVGELLLEFYFKVRDFLNIYDLVDENYVVYTELESGGDFRIKLFCVNPAANLQACLNKGISAVFFSATLLPVKYYRTLFSQRTDDYAIYAQSPFAAKNRCLVFGNDVSSRYTRRGYGEYRRIARYIIEAVSCREGNYMVFFPSYRLMEDVYQVFWDEFREEGIRCMLQTPSMNEQEREEFLEAFQKGSGVLVGFCVMGGIFGEGIDLIGDRLIGAVIVGTGIPQISYEREILKQYYDEKGYDGFSYAYRYPGMNKVLQAAGRVIRTQEDKGVILLLDDRFLLREYREMFPREWVGGLVCQVGGVGEVLREFWENT